MTDKEILNRVNLWQQKNTSNAERHGAHTTTAIREKWRENT